jgi:uncharacterized membrane protein YgdD (TMEM256/DUF423 family)
MPQTKHDITLLTFALAGALLLAASVAVDAAFAHAIDPDVQRWAQTMATVIRTQQIHGLGLILIALTAPRAPRRASRWRLVAGALLLCGCVLFCVNLQLRAMLAIDTFRTLVPMGGGSFIFGWLAFAIALVCERRVALQSS